jgi:hypothetical protein
VNDLVLANFSNTPHHADWLSLHSRIETAAKGRNALAHHWVLIYPNEKPGRRWCLMPRLGRLRPGSPQNSLPDRFVSETFLYSCSAFRRSDAHSTISVRAFAGDQSCIRSTWSRRGVR